MTIPNMRSAGKAPTWRRLGGEEDDTATGGTPLHCMVPSQLGVLVAGCATATQLQAAVSADRCHATRRTLRRHVQRPPLAKNNPAATLGECNDQLLLHGLPLSQLRTDGTVAEDYRRHGD